MTSTGAGGSGGLPTITVLPTASASSTGLGSGGKQGTDVGELVGAAVAGAAGAGLIMLLIMMCRRRRRRRGGNASVDQLQDGAHLRRPTSSGGASGSTMVGSAARERHKSELMEDERMLAIQEAAERRHAKWEEHIASVSRDDSQDVVFAV